VVLVALIGAMAGIGIVPIVGGLSVVLAGCGCFALGWGWMGLGWVAFAGC